MKKIIIILIFLFTNTIGCQLMIPPHYPSKAEQTVNKLLAKIELNLKKKY